MSALHAACRVALNRPRVLGAVAAVFVLEALLRVPFAVVHPVLAVLVPPVIAVPLLGAAAPSVRTAVERPEASPDWRLGTLRDRLDRRLLGAAVVGHAVALAVGTAGFLLLDTAVRATVYALGGSVPAFVVLLAPLPGLAVGAVVAWGLLIPELSQLAAGESTAAAARAPVLALARPRGTARSLALHAVCGLLGAGAFLTGMTVVTRLVVRQTPGHPLAAFSLTAGLLTVTAVVLGSVAYPLRVAWADCSVAAGTVPARRVALAALVVAGLVVGAGAIRLTETRPTPDAPAAAGPAELPENATAAYAAAVERTSAGDSRVVVEYGDGIRAVYAMDREPRRYRTERHDADGASVAYVDAGVADAVGARRELFALGVREVDGRSVHALPAYWRVADDYSVTEGLQATVPRSGTGQWRTVERDDGTVTVELTDGEAVARALGISPGENTSYRSVWIRMRVDAEGGVLLGGESRLNATGERSLDRRASYDVTTGDDVRVDRREALGGRTLGEWLWKLFAY